MEMKALKWERECVWREWEMEGERWRMEDGCRDEKRNVKDVKDVGGKRCALLRRGSFFLQTCGTRTDMLWTDNSDRISYFWQMVASYFEELMDALVMYLHVIVKSGEENLFPFVVFFLFFFIICYKKNLFHSSHFRHLKKLMIRFLK